MSASSAKRLVVVSLLAAGGLTTVRDIAAGKGPSLRVGLGVGIAAVLLLGAADYAPAIAGSFGALVLVAALFTTGEEALTAVRKAIA